MGKKRRYGIIWKGEEKNRRYGMERTIWTVDWKVTEKKKRKDVVWKERKKKSMGRRLKEWKRKEIKEK